MVPAEAGTISGNNPFFIRRSDDQDDENREWEGPDPSRLKRDHSTGTASASSLSHLRTIHQTGLAADMQSSPVEFTAK